MKPDQGILEVMNLIRDMPGLEDDQRKWVRTIAELAWCAGWDEGFIEGKASVTAPLKSKWNPEDLDRVMQDCYRKGVKGAQFIAALRKIGMSKHEAEARLYPAFRSREKHRRPNRERM